MCEIKPHLSFKMRTADICADCMAILQARLDRRSIESVVAMLEAVRKVAVGRAPPPLRSDKPLVRQVDESHPFPLAYCLRVMQSEQTYTRKWLHMYDLYRLVVKYLTFCLLADRRKSEVRQTGAIDLTRLAFAQDGQWGWMALTLAEEVRSRGDRSFFANFAESFDPGHLEAARSASKSLVKTRNDQIQGHGFTPPEPVCQEACERHFADLKTLLNFIKPLAGYQLLAAAGAVQPTGASWRWQGKRMMGSNPIFDVEEQVTAGHPGSGCVLVRGDGDLLSLHPWLLLNYCPVCYREMVFVYDRMDKRDGSQTVVLREYPTNHQQVRGDLMAAVCEGLGVGAGGPGR
jgi:hypothetical protein